MWTVAWSGIWIGAQPWLKWPGLWPDTSHRLSLVVCATALGLGQLGDTKPVVGLPRTWVAWIALVIAVLMTHNRAAILTGGYFTFFQETVVFSDGLFLVVALTWGAWALRQQSLETFWQMRWLGLLVLGANLIAAVWQRSVGTPRATGMLGTDQALGAYAVAWVPLCWVWASWLVLVPLTLMMLAGKTTAWLGAMIALCWMRPRWAWSLLPIGLIGARWWASGAFWLKVQQRVATWHTALRAIHQHPWIGYSFHPLAERALPQYGYTLPSVHSDVLALAFHAGIPVALGAIWLIWVVLRTPVDRPITRALQASLAAIAVMSCGQSVVSHARIGGLMLFLLVWWLVESSTERRTECERG